MSDTVITDEQLMAYADGMLSETEANQVRAAVAQDKALAAKLDIFRQTATRLSDLSHAQTIEIPSGLEEKVWALAKDNELASSTVDLSAQREARKVPLWQVPLAASLFLAIGVGASLFWQKSATQTTNQNLQFAGMDGAAINEALNTLPSGENRSISNGSNVAAIASFTNAQGEFCREMEYRPVSERTIVSVACREETKWVVHLAVIADAQGDTGYAPASSLETLDAYLSSSKASAPMSLEAEASELRKLIP